MLREQLDCIVIDTETTGFSVPKGDRIVEVATVTIKAGAIASEWSTLVNPGRGIPVDSTKVHGITDKMVATAPHASGVGRGLHFRIEGAVLAIHNSPFDVPFLAQMFRDADCPQPTNLILDTLGLARGLNGVGRNSLIDLITQHGIEPEPAHRALGDTRMTAKLLLKMVDLYEAKGFDSIEKLAEYSIRVMQQTAGKFGGRR